MSAKLGGREPKGHVVGARVVFDLPLYIISYQSAAVDGMSSLHHDGQRLHRLSEMTVSHGVTVYEWDFAGCKEYLSRLGCKKITAEQMKADLPRFCPKCLQEGYPHMRPYMKIKSDRNKKGVDTFNHNLNYDEIKNIRYEVHYGHSKPLLHQCHIGYWTPKGYELAREIDVQKMSPFYIVKQNGGLMEFDLPGKKIKRGKVLS
jgi:hypothetical protein